MAIDRQCRGCVALFVILLASLVPVAAIYAQKDLREQTLLALEAAVFELEVKAQPERALEIVAALEPGEIQSEWRAAFWVMRMRCLLALGREQEARGCYGKLQEIAVASPSWLEVANAWAPDSFISRSVPWISGELHWFRTIAEPNGREDSGWNLIVAERAIAADGASVWILRGWDFSVDMSAFVVHLDPESLQVRSTRLLRQPLDALERSWLGLVKTSELDADRSPEMGSMGWMLRGLGLQQHAFALGFEASPSLYDLESGFTETLRVSITTQELLSLSHGQREACWLVDVSRAESTMREQFAFGVESGKRLFQYRNGQRRAVLRHSEPMNLREIDGTRWVRLKRSHASDSFPVNGLELWLEQASGLRCYVGPDHVFSSLGYRWHQPDDSGSSGVDAAHWQLQNLRSGERIGWALRDPATGRSAVMFGIDTNGKGAPGVAVFQALAALRNSGEDPE